MADMKVDQRVESLVAAKAEKTVGWMAVEMAEMSVNLLVGC